MIKVKVRVKFVKEDQWIGRYYKVTSTWAEKAGYGLVLYKNTVNYICIIPCFPIIITKEWK